MDVVIFLRDPMTPQPHEPDINALVRACDVHNVPVRDQYCDGADDSRRASAAPRARGGVNAAPDQRACDRAQEAGRTD